MLGIYRSASIDFETGNILITFEIKDKDIDLQKFKDKELNIDVRVHRKNRGLKANAYFHVLVDRIADKLGISKARCKNELICSYGQKEYIDGKPVCIKTNIPLEAMREQETMHCKFIRQEGETSFYWVYRESHTLDSKEFSILLDGTVEEAKAQGIETLPSEEMRRMLEQWKPIRRMNGN